MKECIREHDVTAAVTSGRWPDSCAEDLRNHAMACGVCKDVVLVASALHEELAPAVADARVPSAGLVWWRAELRARQEATREAERPVVFVHAFGIAYAVGVALALIVGMLPSVREILPAFTDLPRLGLLIGAFAALLVIAPLALYFVFSDK